MGPCPTTACVLYDSGSPRANVNAHGVGRLMDNTGWRPPAGPRAPTCCAPTPAPAGAKIPTLGRGSQRLPSTLPEPHCPGQASFTAGCQRQATSAAGSGREGARSSRSWPSARRTHRTCATPCHARRRKQSASLTLPPHAQAALRRQRQGCPRARRQRQGGQVQPWQHQRRRPIAPSAGTEGQAPGARHRPRASDVEDAVRRVCRPQAPPTPS